MKKVLIIFFAVLSSVAVSAQITTTYFMPGARTRTDMNPALTPRRGFIEIPVVGGLNVALNSNYFCVGNFLYSNNGQLVTFMHQSVDGDKFMRKLSRNNFINIDTKLNILSFGNHDRRYYWNFGWNLRVIGDVNIPKDFFSLLKNTSSGSYDLKRFAVSADVYSELALGFAFPIIEDFIDFGFKAKALIGLAQVRTEFDEMSINGSAQKWNAVLSGRMRANVAGYDWTHGLDGLSDMSNFDFSKIKNIGAAIDFGVNIHLLDDRLRVSAAVVDLGFVYWSKATSGVSQTFEASVDYSGYNLETEKFEANSDEKFSDLEFTNGTGYSRRLNTTLNIGAEYNILDDKIGFGLLSSTKFSPSYTTTELTASVNFRPINWFGFSLSHALIHNRLGVIGAALNFDACWVNLLLGMDYIAFKYAKIDDVMLPLRSKSMNVYFGLAIPLRTHEKAVRRYEHRMNKKADRAAAKAGKIDL